MEQPCPIKIGPKFIAVYARVSTARQEEDGTIEGQLGAVREYAEKSGYTILKEYVDEGWSGDTLVRPSLDTLRHDARAKAWQAVLIYDPDRLARRYSFQELVMDELREAGVEVMFVTIPAPKNPEEKILHGVRGLFAEYERAKIKERFRLGRVRSIKEGNVLTGTPPYGYRVVPKKKGELRAIEIVPEEARNVLMMFKLATHQKFPLKQIAHRMKEMGIRPIKCRRGVWNTSTIHGILKNETYAGKAHWYRTIGVPPKNPTKPGKYRRYWATVRKLRPREDWLTVPVPAIVDERLFKLTQKQLKENIELSAKNKRHQYLLGGRIYCTCLKKRHGLTQSGGGYRYYVCTDNSRSLPLREPCQERRVNATLADALVWDKLTELMCSPEQIWKQLELSQKEDKSNQNAHIADISTIKKELATLKEQEDRYNRAYGAGLLSMEQLREYIVPMRERIHVLESEQSNILHIDAAKDSGTYPTHEEVEVFAAQARVTLQKLDFELKKEVVLAVVEKIVATREHLEVTGHINPTALAEYSSTDGRSDGKIVSELISPFQTGLAGSIHDIHTVWMLPAKSISFKLSINLPVPQKPRRLKLARLDIQGV